jgi:ankyrin repeat protein
MLAAGYGETAVVEALLKAGADVTARNEGGLTALMMVKQKHYVDVINLLHEAERDAGVGEGSCTSKNEPGSGVVTFLKPVGKS